MQGGGGAECTACPSLEVLTLLPCRHGVSTLPLRPEKAPALLGAFAGELEQLWMERQPVPGPAKCLSEFLTLNFRVILWDR